MALDRRLSVAPMMAYTDRHFRRLVRLYTQRCLLYTEMVVCGTILNHRRERYLDDLLAIDDVQHPIAVQLGGDDPTELAECARICAGYGYDEINLNVGCPSPRVLRGNFGVCLMRDADLVARSLDAMRRVVDVPVTVKHRIGVDEDDSYTFMEEFVRTCAQAGTDIFIVHARKAWLKGLNPAQNRSIPPLRYDDVYRLKNANRGLQIVINGGIDHLEHVHRHLNHVDGVMIGRAAYHNPELFAQVDWEVFGEPKREVPSTESILSQVDDYLHEQCARGARQSAILKHCLGLFKGRRGSRHWRRSISAMIQQPQRLQSLAQVYRQTIGPVASISDSQGS